MDHFSKEKWIAFKRDEVLEEEKRLMEDHLYTCDTCMDSLLNLIDDEELDFAEMMISEDFTSNLMKKLDPVTPISRLTKKKKMIENIFIYYVAAASVVLVLTAGGAFTKMTEIPLENIRVDSFKTQESLGSIFAFTEKITDSTNSFINNFEINPKGGK